jgi:hypothetical protein
MPPLPQEYVNRRALEGELHRILFETERFPLVTLHGRGGIGKTSLALQVLHEIAHEEAFLCILWFSARDIDLLQQGPQTVEPQALTRKEIANQFADKMEPKERVTKSFDELGYFSRMLAAEHDEISLLFVFDNFETVRNPTEVYEWLVNTIRLPNKILITTRFRDFKADYPVEVGGMTEQEFGKLVSQTAGRLGLWESITDSYMQELYDECDGHPYLAKVYLGEAAVRGGQPDVKRVLASREEILEALFERSFGMLPPHAQRVFLTLCNWRSQVPRLALEAALLRTENERMDVENAISTLKLSSLVDVAVSERDGQEWLSVPLAANLFGRRKLAVSPMKSAIEADTRILQTFGAARGSDVHHGLEPAVRRVVRRIAEKAYSEEDVSDLREVLEYIARSYPRAWLHVAELSGEVGESAGFPNPTEAIKRYLEADPTATEAWRTLAERYRVEGDWLAEMNALLQLASQEDVEYEEVSNAANRFNYLRAGRYLDIDSDEKRIIAERLRDLMLGRLNAANATDLSRAAWLCLHLGDEGGARSLVEKGLYKEPENTHCVKLWNKLQVS